MPRSYSGFIGIAGAELMLLLVVAVFLLLGVLVLGLIIYFIFRSTHTSAPIMTPAPTPVPPEQSQARKNLEHIRLLAIFHFIFAALGLLGIAFLFAHYFFMHSFFANPEIWKSQPNAMPPKQFFEVFIWFYAMMGVIIVAGMVLNILSGIFLLRKTHRLFSLVVAGLNCLQIPFGTALGVFSIVVLARDSVRVLYDET